LAASALAGLAAFACRVHAEDLNAPAVVEITDRAAVTDICPIGVNPDNFGGWAALDYTSNQFITGGGFEPVSMRWKGCVVAGGKGWFEADVMPPFWSGALASSGALDGSRVRIYRMVKADGSDLPLVPGPGWWNHPQYVDVDQAHHVVRIADTTIARASQTRPRGGYAHSKCTEFGPYLYGMQFIPFNRSWTDVLFNSPPGARYFYKVAAVNRAGLITPLAQCAEVRSAAGGTAAESGPRIFNRDAGNGSVADGLLGYRLTIDANKRLELNLYAKGGRAPLKWEIREGELPAGIALTQKPEGTDWQAPRAAIAGTATAAPEPRKLVIKVSDAEARSDERTVWINPTDPVPPNYWQASRARDKKEPPPPPGDVKAVANADSITLTWSPSAGPDVVGHVIFRSDVPFDQQERRIYLADSKLELRPGDQVVIEWLSLKLPGPEHWPPDVVQAWSPARNAPFFNLRNIPAETRFELVEHPGKPLPADFTEPGDSCLKITHPTAGPVTLEQFVFRVPPLAGSHIRVELWARQEGLPDGTLEFQVDWSDPKAQDIVHRWKLDGTWRKCEHEFDVPKTVSGNVRLKFTGPGTVWLDDFEMYRKDANHPGPWVMGKEVFDALLAAQPATGKKGSMRYMRRIFDNQSPMGTLLKWQWQNPEYDMSSFTSRSNLHGYFWGQGYGTFKTLLGWCLATGDSPANRCVPHFTLRVEFGEEDWRNLVEYLAGPPDTPYGAIRTRQRGGNLKPWTDEFREIIIELGNESWHNGVMGGWTGYGIYGWIHGCGREQGLFAKHFFDEAVGSMPLWKERRLGEKIKFALDSNSGRGCWNYGETGMEFAKPKNVAYVTHTGYVGPQWEYGEKTTDTLTDDGFQACLLAADDDVIDLIAEARERINKTHGLSYGNILYESGASGFDWRRSGMQSQYHYGHSLAMAVSALDAWLYGSYRGFKDMALYSFAQGRMWASHDTGPADADPMRPHPQWLAITLRNRYARGTTMLETKAVSMPTIGWELRRGKKVEKPLVRVYALRDEGSCSVLVLSRKLDGKHNGRDFGDGVTPVTLRLPFQQARKIALYRLAGDPRRSNLDQRNVQLESVELPSSVLATGTLAINKQSGGSERGMPPGGIFLYLFQDLVKP
jgi:hypothetical protein